MTMIFDLATHAKQIAQRPRSEPQARKDALLLRYRSFSLAVLCAVAEIERAQATGDLNLIDLITRLSLSNVKAAFDGIKDES